MFFLIDAQLPPSLEDLCKYKGYKAEHVYSIGLTHASDTAIWDYALKNNRIIITKDDDFVFRSQLSSTSPVIIWLRIGNCTNKALVHWFAPHLDIISEKVKNGESIIELV
jgi:predicted nuclease of predicted toxin-antitoxin system